jgi:hypothetical protein
MLGSAVGRAAREQADVKVKVTIVNQIAQSTGPNPIELELERTATIDDILFALAEMVFPKRPAKLLDLTWRGTPLRDGLKTLT